MIYCWRFAYPLRFSVSFLGNTAHPRSTPPSGVLHATYPTVTAVVLKALCLCQNLHSFTWVDDTSALHTVFLSFLRILRDLPLRALTLRTKTDLGEDTWAFLNTIPVLQKVAIWCMDGPPRVLQGWAPRLGSTLTELELGVRIRLSDHDSLLTHFMYHIAVRRRSRDHFNRRTLPALLPTRLTTKGCTEQCHSGHPYFAPRSRCTRHRVSPPLSAPPVMP